MAATPLDERDRLLALGAGATGLISTVIVLLCLCLPGTLPLPRLAVAVPILVVTGLAQQRVAATARPGWTVLALVAGLAAYAPLAVPGPGVDAQGDCLALLGSGVLGSCGFVLVTTPRRRVLLAVAFAATLAVTVAALRAHEGPSPWTLGFVATGWLASTLAGAWIARLVPRALTRIRDTRDALTAQRVASEAEAQRRQGARLLHDTVLATLTLLAHSGVGVGEEALRTQAGEDAALLRQLRHGHTPQPVASADYTLRPVEETALGTTLESVKQRFARMGLDVAWHGSGQVLLRSDVLDAFLLALTECLENVRRHSGVNEAHVTITEDERTVRAMVTDGGVGFEPDSVGGGRLGLSESIVARLRDVGGRSRLFSSPGSGTTVVLEAPK